MKRFWDDPGPLIGCGCLAAVVAWVVVCAIVIVHFIVKFW